MAHELSDPGLEALLDLDGQVLYVEPQTKHWVKFEVKRCPVSPERPHGLRYSLTLHGPSGQRLMGYDNAHAVASRKGGVRSSAKTHDHQHRYQRIRPYDYLSAADLLADFWRDVDSVLTERGAL